MHSVYLSLGSNIEPAKNIPKALELLSDHLTVIQASSAWCTAPVGSAGPSFVNLAAQVLTALDRAQLKAQVLQKIESQLGRVRTGDKFAPRTIDIDIILFDNQLIELDLLSMNYLILPLAELLPEYTPPENSLSLGVLATRNATQHSAVRLDNFPQATCD